MATTSSIPHILETYVSLSYENFVKLKHVKQDLSSALFYQVTGTNELLVCINFDFDSFKMSPKVCVRGTV